MTIEARTTADVAARATNGVTGKPSEQELIHELYEALKVVVAFYGSQNNAARALHLSSSTLTRASDAWRSIHSLTGRLPRPRLATLRTLSACDDHRVREAACALLTRRGAAECSIG
jgi:hypothetical protein